jgi:hypothetical protein
VPEPKVVATLLEENTSNQQPTDPCSRDACLLESTRFEESLKVDEIQ